MQIDLVRGRELSGIGLRSGLRRKLHPGQKARSEVAQRQRATDGAADVKGNGETHAGAIGAFIKANAAIGQGLQHRIGHARTVVSDADDNAAIGAGGTDGDPTACVPGGVFGKRAQQFGHLAAIDTDDKARRPLDVEADLLPTRRPLQNRDHGPGDGDRIAAAVKQN